MHCRSTVPIHTVSIQELGSSPREQWWPADCLPKGLKNAILWSPIAAFQGRTVLGWAKTGPLISATAITLPTKTSSFLTANHFT